VVQPHRVFALSPVADQQLAGLAMLAEQLLSLGACVAFLLGTRSRLVVRTLPALLQKPG